MNIKIEKPTFEDADIIAKYANNIKIWRGLTDNFPHPYSKQNAIDFIKIIEKEEPQRTFKITKDGQFVGFTGIVLQEGIYRKNAEIGYWIAEEFWGQGIASEAVNLLVKYLCKTFYDIEKIYAKVFDSNIASIRVLEKNRFRKEATLEQIAYKDNEYKDIHYYSFFIWPMMRLDLTKSI